ncbi:zinc-binding dehydrogenase [Nonomuraea sp. NPDC003804]|uniref:zinc-binding dehydrogenase n=1 Tax=Nonomuraea sp. NPDC003804 TaxID=3154547 RepID=UPI0033B55EC1
MRAIVMDEFGGPEVLRPRTVDDPVPGEGQVLVEVAFASITFVETQVRAGTGPFAPPALPRTPGNGVGGRIVAVGPGVDQGLVGTTVVTTTGGAGGYASLAVAAAADAVPVPDGVPLRDAVALLADGRTAVMLHEQAEIKPGERVLVLAAGGGVGGLLLQLAKAAGAVVTGAARGKRELVERFGSYVDYSAEGWARSLEADVVFDGVGGNVGTEALTALRPGGRASLYGMASGSWSRTDGLPITVIERGGPPSQDELRRLVARALELAAEGQLVPTVGQTYPLEEAAAAHRAIETRQTTGKTLLVI